MDIKTPQSRINQIFWKIDNYIADFLYGASKFPCGFQKPSVVQGYFENNENGKTQQLFFNNLLEAGYKRTYFQLILPGQTAGLIKKIKNSEEGINEYHIRFYPDCIDIELEYDRFSEKHWREPSLHDPNLLENILDNETDIKNPEKEKIKQQFKIRDFSNLCKRPLYPYRLEDNNKLHYNLKVDRNLSIISTALITLGIVDIFSSAIINESLYPAQPLMSIPIIGLAYFTAKLKNLCKYGTIDSRDIGIIKTQLAIKKLIDDT